ncbi:MAG: molybdopterin-binding protein [Desulfovibrionaceae bacterium]
MSQAVRLFTTVPVQDAVGAVLCHDITRIVPGQSKGPVFRKGHRVVREDIPVLLEVGKEHLYVYEPRPGILHEDDAALRITRACAGANLHFSAPQEGRINFHASCQGLLHVDVETLTRVNSLGEIALASLHGMQEVAKNQPVAGTRVIPLVIEEQKIVALENSVFAPVISVLPFRSLQVGVVTTGSEVYHGRIKDAFGPIVRQKFERLGSRILDQTFTSDDVDMTRNAIRAFIDGGAQMVVVTGGMSVDPDDRTPAAIRAAGGKVVSYGTPTFPGAMFMLAHIGDVPVMGLPGCVMYYKASIFDLVVPRLLAGLEVTVQDIAALGHGGFCANCPECHYPLCPFGKC